MVGRGRGRAVAAAVGGGGDAASLLGGPTDEALGVGRSFVRTRVADPLGHSVVPGSQLAYLRGLLPTLLHDGIDRGRLREDLGCRLRRTWPTRRRPPSRRPPGRGEFEIVIGPPPAVDVRYLALRVLRPDGELLGTALRLRLGHARAASRPG